MGPHVGAILGVGIFYLLSKARLAVQASEVDLLKNEQARRLRQQQLHSIELCDVKYIYDDRYHHDAPPPFPSADEEPPKPSA